MILLNIEMPTCCIECKFAKDDAIIHTYLCTCIGESYNQIINNYKLKRHPNCPLIEQKKGKWISRNSGTPCCSICGKGTDSIFYVDNYCWNCGAKMEG